MITTETNTDELPLLRFPAICTQCRQPFEGCSVPDPFQPSRPLFTKRVCDPCVMAARAEDERKDRAVLDLLTPEARLEIAWRDVCPKAYRLTTESGLTDLGRLRETQPLLSVAEGAEPYRYGHKGLLFRGDSGTGKTRVMWRVLRRQFDAGRLIIAYTAAEFEREYRDAAGAFRLSGWFDRLIKADCFFLDDLGKSRWSQNTVETFFDLVEKRSSNGLPCFITVNYAREQLAEKLALAKDEAEPMLRRLVDNCDCQTFKVKRPRLAE